MAENENAVNTESPKNKSFFNLKAILVFVPILLFTFIFAFILMNKIVKPKLQYSSEGSNNEKVDDEKVGEIYLVEDIIVNPKDTVGRRYINVSIGLECKDSSIISKLEGNDVKLRDYLITLFSNCKFEDLDDAEDKEHLRKKIKNDLNKLISKNGIQAIYFTNFVLQ